MKWAHLQTYVHKDLWSQEKYWRDAYSQGLCYLIEWEGESHSAKGGETGNKEQRRRWKRERPACAVMGITERTVCVCLVAGLIYSEAIIPASSLSGADPTGRHYFTLHCGTCVFLFVLALYPHYKLFSLPQKTQHSEKMLFLLYLLWGCHLVSGTWLFFWSFLRILTCWCTLFLMLSL